MGRFWGWRRAAGPPAGVAAFGAAVPGGQATAAGPSDGAQDQDQEQGAPPPGGRTAAEWTTLVVSIAVVAALVGAALYEYYGREEPTGARLSVELAVEEAERRDGHSYVPYTVENVGDQPAEGVVVVFEVKQGGEVVEESTTEIAFLPSRGRAEGEMVTALDPATHELSARVATLQSP